VHRYLQAEVHQCLARHPRDIVKIQLLCSVAYDVLVITCHSLVVATQLTLEAHVWSLCDA